VAAGFPSRVGQIQRGNQGIDVVAVLMPSARRAPL
jgi:hypothetical protein